MENGKILYEVFLDDTVVPPMYGIRGGGATVKRVSTDYQEMNHLARLCVEGGLDPLHLGDVVADFVRA